MATSRRLSLTRDQLATFLENQEQIRQFELLFSTVDTIAPIVGTDFEFAADSAFATANEALAQLANIAQTLAVNCALAENKANQALALVDNLTKAVEGLQMTPKAEQLDALAKAIEGLQMTPPPREFKRARYGSFYDTTTQTATTINTAKAITFNSTDLSNGVFIGTPTSRIIVDSEGIYNFDTSFQLDKTSGGTAEFYFWFRLNGTDVPDSASQIRIQGNDAEIFSSLNYFFDLKAGDYVEMMFSTTSLSVELLSVVATPPVPGIPSIILTVSNNIGGVQ
jgi:hypothetical protein